MKKIKDSVAQAVNEVLGFSPYWSMRLLRKFITGQFLLDQKRGRIALILPTSDFRVMKLRWLYPDSEESISLKPGVVREHKKLLRVNRYRPLDLQNYQALKVDCPVRVMRIGKSPESHDIKLEALLIPPDFLEPNHEELIMELVRILDIKDALQTTISRRNVGNIQKILVRIWS